MSCLMGYSIVANLCCGDIERFKVIINGGLAQEYMKFKYLLDKTKISGSSKIG